MLQIFMSTPGRHMYSSCQWVSKEHRGKWFWYDVRSFKEKYMF